MTDLERMYLIVGGSESDSDDELYAKYSQLRTKYQNDRFLEGEAGNEAARKLTELNEAYYAIVDYRKSATRGADRSAALSEVDALIKAGKISEAQAALDNLDERSAEWHYLQSVVFYKKNWSNESKKQLEIAMAMDPSVEKYKTAYEKLCKQLDFNDTSKKGKTDYDRSVSGNGRFNESTYEEPTDMMGGDSCIQFCCRSMLCSALLNCCCSCR